MDMVKEDGSLWHVGVVLGSFCILGQGVNDG